MELIVYGAPGDRYYPRISFTQKGDRSVSVEFEGSYHLDLSELTGNGPRVSWRDLAFLGIEEEKQEEVFGPDRSGPGYPYVHLVSEEQIRNPDPTFDHLELFRALIKHLSKLVGSEPERKFFQAYAKYCVDEAKSSMSMPGDSSLDAVRLWNFAALIPQAWVNWIDYDPDDKERKERAAIEPFRVDFLLSPDEKVSPNLSVVELDGMGHFATSELDAAGERHYNPSMERYTEHVKKDRWLRKQGYDVVRFSTREIREMLDTDRGAKKVANRLRWTLRKMSGAWS